MDNADNLTLNNGIFNTDSMLDVEYYTTYVDVLGNEVLNPRWLQFPIHHENVYTNDGRKVVGFSRWAPDGNRIN